MSIKQSKEPKKHLSSLIRLNKNNQHLITKSDLSNKIKLTKLVRSGSELKNYLLTDTNNIKLEETIQTEMNVNFIEHEQPDVKLPSTSIYNEIIKRVLKRKNSI